MNDARRSVSMCDRCGAMLAPGSLGGSCPRCLMELNLGTPTEAPQEETVSALNPAVSVSAEDLPSPSEIARHFPHLEVLEYLGRGGMGIVYKARQVRLDRLVALKILTPEKGRSAQFSERFSREAQALARLNHPSIVAVHDFGEVDGLCYLVMEFVDGVSLRHLLHAHQLTPDQALAIVPKICEALQYAHDRGVVHRDIKPENILLDREGHVKIADFGIAKILAQEKPQAAITQEEQVIGTPHYMAPEQVEHPQRIDHRADIYSLGVVFYEMLTGELPLGKFPPPSQKVAVDTRLDEVVLSALEKEPDNRYQQASEVKEDVETIVATPQPPHPGPARVSPGLAAISPGRGSAASPLRASGWIGAARWTARALGTLMLAGFVVVLMINGMMPLDRLDGREQVVSAAWGLALLGFLLGWKFDGAAALLIALGSACFPLAQDLQLHPYLSALPFCGIVAGLYAFCWWTTRRRKTLAWAGGSAAVLAVLGSCLLGASRSEVQARIPARNPNAGRNLIDLTAHYNAVLGENWMDRGGGDHLGELPTGIQKLADTEFDIRGVIQVEQNCRKHPPKVSGIAVGQPCLRMHFLHAARNAGLIEDGVQIGSYVIHLANGTRQEIPLVLGRELVDWRIQPRSKEAYRTAWTGQNPHTRKIQKFIRLFKTTWENPFPEVEVQSVDFVSACPGPCPFLVALTVDTNPAMAAVGNWRAERWKQDLDYFVRELPARHKDFSKLITKESFERDVRELQREVSRWSDAEIILHLQRLTASLGVAHTKVGWPAGELAFRRYPLVLFWYSDGLGVFAAAPEYRQAIGCRVAAIGSLTPQQVEAAVAPYISRENEAWLHQQSPAFFCVPEVLECLHLAKPDGPVRFSLIQPDGKPLTLDVAPFRSGTPAQLVLPWNALPMAIPLCHKNPHLPYWHEFLPETGALYIHYRACENAPHTPFAAFAKGLFAFADTQTVRRVIVDLRNNSGGNSAVIKPLVEGLKLRPAMSAKGRLYALIGRSTFSSGLLAAIDLQKEAGAILVGEPTGGKPNCYGEMPSFRLPHSQLVITYCVKYFRLIQDADPPSLNPDLPATLALPEFLAGRDPALETALQHQP